MCCACMSIRHCCDPSIHHVGHFLVVSLSSVFSEFLQHLVEFSEGKHSKMVFVNWLLLD